MQSKAEMRFCGLPFCLAKERLLLNSKIIQRGVQHLYHLLLWEAKAITHFKSEPIPQRRQEKASQGSKGKARLGSEGATQALNSIGALAALFFEAQDFTWLSEASTDS